MKRNGYTLVELIVTIVIISILANIAIARIEGFTAKAKCTEAVVMLGTYERLQGAFVELYDRVGSAGEIGLEVGEGTYFSFAEVTPSITWITGGGVQTAGQDKVTICHDGHTQSVADPGYVNGLLPQGVTLGPCETSSSSAASSAAASSAAPSSVAASSIAASSTAGQSSSAAENKNPMLVATSKSRLSLYCRQGDAVYSQWAANGTVHGNVNGGNCGMYMGAWFAR